MQQLWKLELAWDETLPADIHTAWVDFSSHLSELHNLTFRRKILSSKSEKIQLHGFCDASEKAYGASTNPDDWRHVRSHENPADQLSRGQSPEEFVRNDLWRTGPSWLKEEESTWPTFKIQIPTLDEEMRKDSCFTVAVNNHEILERYSSIDKLRRILSYCLRMKKDNQFKGIPTVQEIRQTDQRIIKLVQSGSFMQELHDLQNGKPLNSKSRLLSLSPFLDEAGILRVGGRLRHADISHNQRHPILLPKSNHITNLIIENGHQSHGHAGVQSTLYSLRQRYWIIDGRNQVRKIILRCVKCMRAKPPTINYIVGQLPKDRVTEARPFSNVGVDYCGPFYMKEKRFRNRARVKIYVAVFVCLVVKAVHLEVVSDMTSEGFIAALRRFVARRGKPSIISSDNGSNFVGAKTEIEDIQRLLGSNEHNTKVHNFLLEKEIKWKFIPPSSPHFGGIWEAAVKSFKHHLRRILGNVLLCFEDFNTLVVEIESILNSRPLAPLSSDPNDPLALTPGHFLIGEPMTSLPEIDLGDYTVDVGSVFVIKNDNLPPLQWHLGRVIAAHPGADGIIRTVQVKTATGTFDRSIKKLAPLPIENIERTIASTSSEKL
ncbi:uncharacterized protein [Neodiprion pinetum]|uniref:uncharacterized protein n=1 Tax=Neodiprion pinetum TaxID=441929 RepID=UPI001EDE2F83|nr:uncharacterized protein LOC124224782 [Neodiprion pinetum]